MRPALVAFVLAPVLVLSCKSSGPSAQPKGAGGEPGTDGTTPAGNPSDVPADARGKAATPGKCGATGKPWDGKPQDCPYEHAGCCYAAAEAACAAAGCGGRECVVMESYPAQVRCDTASDPSTP